MRLTISRCFLHIFSIKGIVEPVVAEQRVQGVGLGASGSKLSYAATRKERLKQAAIQRFQDINDWR